LSRDTIHKVVDKFVLQLEVQLADRGVTIELDQLARDYLADKGYDPLYGARPLGRVIQDSIKKPLAEELLFGKLAKGGVVTVTIKDEKLAFKFKAAIAPEKPGDSADPPEKEPVFAE